MDSRKDRPILRVTPSPRSSPSRHGPPHLAFGLTDGPRAISELAWFFAARGWLASRYQGTGRAVLVIPGLRAGDWSTKPLRGLLGDVGYEPYGWGLGTNVGPTERIISGLDALLERVTERHGSPVSVIGQSLGGMLGAELARRNPDMVDRLITLGSPMTIAHRRQTWARREYARHEAAHLPEFAFDRWIKAPRPDIPCSSIYSRIDGIVHWSACLYPPGELTENIEIYGSHLGMAAQPAAVYATLDRLAAGLDPWQKFVPPRELRLAFPTPRLAPG